MGLPMENAIQLKCLKTSLRSCFFLKRNNNTPCNHATVYFNNDPIIRENVQKHIGLFLDSKLNFSGPINEKVKKATKGINVIRKRNLSLARSSLLT